ncbi:low-density lipoprotein receptor-related protein 6-like, partial [Aplysia californica]|uniref:Low-density lipoprotein receptor-related protein 6-like n=1 Tax=Aplysia californica TaxID=6500 RepID=A0ABM1W2R6_APLCA
MGRLWIAIVLALAVGLKTQLTFSIVHEKSLIWDTSRQRSFYIPAMIMAVQGDPTEWVAQTRPEIKYIEAPHFNWEFRALGFDWDAKSIYWSEQKNKKIQALVLNGSTDTRTLFAGTSTEVSGIAVDWLSRNLYFTDTVYNWIMMTPSTPGRAGYRIVVQDGLDSPHGLAIYPQKGYLIWSDWGARPRIEVSDLEGQNRRIIVERDILKPMGVTIDYVHDRLYWVDSAKFTVEAVQLDGLGRQLIHKVEDITLTGIALYQDFIFLTERKLATLRVLDKKTPVKSYKLGRNPFDIMMYDGSQQAGNSSACELLGCEQMCIHDPVTGPKCICGEGYVPGDEESISCNCKIFVIRGAHNGWIGPIA